MIGHTPGPWFIEEPDPESGLAMVEGALILGPERQLVAEILSADLNEADGRFATHDARLIAAAPDLLALLVELTDIEGPQPGHVAWYWRAQDAIAKATGGTP